MKEVKRGGGEEVRTRSEEDVWGETSKLNKNGEEKKKNEENESGRK